MNILNFKEGETYICKKTGKPWWTVGKEYPVVLIDGKLKLIDDDGDSWTVGFLLNESGLHQFKLKEKKFDLNTLTLEELDEYLQLATDLEEAEYLMKDFIERMTK